MRADALTIAAIVFVVGLLLSLSGIFERTETDSTAPSDLQRGLHIMHISAINPSSQN